MTSSGHLKPYFVADLKRRNKVINMNKKFNEHITDIFTDDRLRYLHQLQFSYHC